MSNIRVLDFDSIEFERLQTAVTLLNTFDKSASYRWNIIYFDFGQNWKWTTIIVEKNGSQWGGYQITPNQQKAVIEAETMEALVEACKAIIESK